MNTLAYKFDQTQALVTKARPFLIWKRVDERSSPSAPQVRSGKTVITQRTAEATDLTKGQSIAVIYAEAAKEYILLNAVLKPVEKPTEKPVEKK